LPSLYIDGFADAQSLRRRISGAFARAAWNLTEDIEAADVVFLDSSVISEASFAVIRETSARALLLMWGADDPAFTGGLALQADGVVDRDDPEDDWLRAAHELISGFGWISPPLVPRFRAASAAVPAPVTSGQDTWRRVLSSAEYDIAQLAVRGLSNAEIAEERWVREGTIKQQLSSVYRKLGLRGRSALISLGYRRKRRP
jgi:DNA-binding NarL/FixJ family response regulator